ncbi:FecR domain-containing protein [Phocaeicola sp. KGMB11183]|uniref:FecR domain-containing protein n=1 Tax=Phocaeicola acetigenes TaxID=3016083 RepID=A0ABT4PIY9_9BACT|nr:FecR domain-containing protein [Phocaeicola sp. KGMB11183]MCZ8373022.1 FecR domain-containing protein [Phocaeicola sp. KGMB11183]
MQHDKHTQIDEWIVDYLNGTLDRNAFDRLTQWASETEENRRYIRQHLELWFASEEAAKNISFDKEKAFQRFLERTAVAKENEIPVADIHVFEKRKERVYFGSWKTYLRVAAVILILLLPFVGYWQGKEAVRHSFSDIVVEAPMGARTKLYLPDGTLVWLNAGSRLAYSQGFGVDDRRLNMEGEGYFEVSRNEALPFEIQTREVGLKVLGTKFNFRNYSDDEEVTVNLMEGKVSLHNEVKSMPELYLAPNEKMVMNKLTGEMIKTRTDASRSNVWINDELFFDEDLLEDIAKRLMRSYDVQIEVADSLRDRRFYGSFTVMGNTIEEVLSTIASTNQMRYRYENGKYILY